MPFPPTPSNSPSNTPTPSITASNTPTLSPTQSVCPTNTPTNTSTINVTPTQTPTISVTPSNTPTISVTPSNTATQTNTPTQTRTPNVTPSVTATNTPTGTPPVVCNTNWTVRNADCGFGTVNDIGINGSFMGTLSGPSTFPLTSTLYGTKASPNGVICGSGNLIQANVTTNLPGTGNCAFMEIIINGVQVAILYFTSNPFPQISGVVINNGDNVEVRIGCFLGPCPEPPAPSSSPTATPTMTPTSTFDDCTEYEIDNTGQGNQVTWNAIACSTGNPIGGTVSANSVANTPCIVTGSLTYTGSPIISILAIC